MKAFRIPLVFVLIVLAGRTFNTHGQTETNLHSFVGSPSDGLFPWAGLIQSSDGNFYGTTFYGGTNDDGTVFRISPSGTYASLYSFAGPFIDGAKPYFAGLIQGSDGNFYGTTSVGGTTNIGGLAAGTVFRISPGGSETVLHSFGGIYAVPADGSQPNAGLVQGNDGNFYGTTTVGGATNCPNGCGTVFRISPGGSEMTLYSFVGYPIDGDGPSAGLVQGSNGNFYGTTEIGGTNGGPYGSGLGTVFRISPSGSETVLYSFGSQPNDGVYPIGGLVQGSDGNLYGTTSGGGGGPSTIFRISPSGSETNLYYFGTIANDGASPEAGLVQGSDGNLYGTTVGGGTYGYGTVFRISPGGTYTNLYSFVGYPTDGANPYAGIVQGGDGNFYGTTRSGGTNDAGTVFKLTVPLNPPANQISAVQIAGNDVAISIPSIAYETYQLQFSSSMNPTNWVNVPGVSVTNSIGALLTLTNFGGAVGPQGFYRFAITP